VLSNAAISRVKIAIKPAPKRESGRTFELRRKRNAKAIAVPAKIKTGETRKLGLLSVLTITKSQSATPATLRKIGSQAIEGFVDGSEDGLIGFFKRRKPRDLTGAIAFSQNDSRTDYCRADIDPEAKKFLTCTTFGMRCAKC
jgi:hypothetical protein